jgi:hypothetical protein
VYAYKEWKQKLFERFENAKESLIQLLSSGVGMVEIMNMCCSFKEINAVQINY